MTGPYREQARSHIDRSHALRGNAAMDALRPLKSRTRSVRSGIPTRSVGTINSSYTLSISAPWASASPCNNSTTQSINTRTLGDNCRWGGYTAEIGHDGTL